MYGGMVALVAAPVRGAALRQVRHALDARRPRQAARRLLRGPGPRRRLRRRLDHEAERCDRGTAGRQGRDRHRRRDGSGRGHQPRLRRRGREGRDRRRRQGAGPGAGRRARRATARTSPTTTSATRPRGPRSSRTPTSASARSNVLANNAGILRFGDIETMATDESSCCSGSTSSAASSACRRSRDTMRTNGGGSIINASSIEGLARHGPAARRTPPRSGRSAA